MPIPSPYRVQPTSQCGTVQFHIQKAHLHREVLSCRLILPNLCLELEPTSRSLLRPGSLPAHSPNAQLGAAVSQAMPRIELGPALLGDSSEHEVIHHLRLKDRACPSPSTPVNDLRVPPPCSRGPVDEVLMKLTKTDR